MEHNDLLEHVEALERSRGRWRWAALGLLLALVLAIYAALFQPQAAVEERERVAETEWRLREAVKRVEQFEMEADLARKYEWLRWRLARHAREECAAPPGLEARTVPATGSQW